MPGAVVDISGDLGCRRGRAARPHVIETGNRRRDAVAWGRGAASVPATAALAIVPLPAIPLLIVARFAVPGFALVRFAVEVTGHFGALGRRDAWFTAHPRNARADQLFDRGDALGVRGCDHGDGGAGPSGASSAADAMDVIIGMMRNV